jgi:hypothetical protein
VSGPLNSRCSNQSGSRTHNNNGDTCKAWWVDFNSDGVYDAPIFGRNYLMSITEYDYSSPVIHAWRHCITDQTTSLQSCAPFPRSSVNGGLNAAQVVWWACETGNDANALGEPSGNAEATVSQSAYKNYANPGVWSFTENSPVTDPWGNTYGAYDYVHSQAGTGESVGCETYSHS